MEEKLKYLFGFYFIINNAPIYIITPTEKINGTRLL